MTDRPTPAQLRSLLDRHGWTTDDLARLMDPPVHRSTVARWLAGAAPYPRHAVQIRRLIADAPPAPEDVVLPAPDETADPDATPEQRAGLLRGRQALKIAADAGLWPMEQWWALDAQVCALTEGEGAASWRARKIANADAGDRRRREERLDRAIEAFRRLGIWPWPAD